MNSSDDTKHHPPANTEHECAQCSYFSNGMCSSCDLLGVERGSRLAQKLRVIYSSLAAHGVSARHTEPIVIAKTPWGTRHKVKMAVSGSIQKPKIGIMRRDLSSDDLSSCPLMPLKLQILFQHLRKLIAESEIQPYDVRTKTGELKYIVVMSTQDLSQGILRFVLRSAECAPLVRRMAPLLQQTFPWLTVVTCNLQPLHAAIFEGDEEIFLTPLREICEHFNGIPLYFGPKSFMQVTPEIAQALYLSAQKFVECHSPRSILDLYCGVGGFSLHAARAGVRTTGVELSSNAIESARRSARELGAKGTSFFACDVEQFLREQPIERPDLIIINPPRRGIGTNVVDHILRLNPRNILYSSCNPETFARDAQLLSANFTLERLTPFDMFPMTSHCEVLGEFARI